MGIFRLFLCVSFLLLSSGSFANEIDLDSGLVAHYKFDGDFTDSSGTGNHGTQQGGVTFVDGVDGQAAYFDGGNNDLISVPHHDSLALDQNLSISLWVKPVFRDFDGEDPSVIMLIKNDHWPNNYSLWTKFSASRFYFQQYPDPYGSNQYTFNVFQSILSDDYVNITIVRDTSVVNIYLNGNLVLTEETAYNAKLGSSPLTIGGGNVHAKYKGSMDELRIYNRALSDSEVIELATSPIIFSQDSEETELSDIGTQYDIENTLNGNMVFSEDTLTVTNSSGIVDSVRSIDLITSGKHYWEVTAHCGPDTLGFETGVIASGSELTGIGYSHNEDIWAIQSDGAMKNSPYYQVMTEGFLETFADDTFQVAVDMDNNKIYYGKNGLWLGGANPELSINPAADNISDEVYAFFWLGDRQCSPLSVTTNFGSMEFKYDVPIGYFKGFCPSGECLVSGQENDNQAISQPSFEPKQFTLQELYSTFLPESRSLTLQQDALDIGPSQTGPHNEVLWRIPVLDEGALNSEDDFIVQIEIGENRNFGSVDKDLLVGISDGINFIQFTNNDYTNGGSGAWMIQDGGEFIIETSPHAGNVVGFDRKNYRLNFSFIDNNIDLKIIDLDDVYDDVDLNFSHGPEMFDRSEGFDLLLVANETHENFSLRSLSVTYPSYTSQDNTLIDSDSDGVDDDSDAFPSNPDYWADSDLDLIPDQWEIKYGLDPLDPNDAALDGDYDGTTAMQEFEEGTIPLQVLDIDGDGNFGALTDGLIILRYAFGLRGDNLRNGVIADGAARTDADDIESYLKSLVPGF